MGARKGINGDVVAALIDAGFSSAEIVAKLNVHRNTIAYHLRRLGRPRKKGADHRIPDEVRDGIVRDHQDGYLVREIAERRGCSTRFVEQVASERCLPGRKGGRPADNARTDEVMRLHGTGLTPSEIAVELGLSRQGVWHHIMKANRGDW